VPASFTKHLNSKTSSDIADELRDHYLFRSESGYHAYHDPLMTDKLAGEQISNKLELDTIASAPQIARIRREWKWHFAPKEAVRAAPDATSDDPRKLITDLTLEVGRQQQTLNTLLKEIGESNARMVALENRIEQLIADRPRQQQLALVHPGPAHAQV